MRLLACITTRNRTQELEACLQALWNSSIKLIRLTNNIQGQLISPVPVLVSALTAIMQ